MHKRFSKCNFKFIFVIIVLCGNLSHAQTSQEVSILAVFELLEAKHNISFSFAENEISHIKIVAPPSANTIEEDLIYLRNNAPLVVNQIDDRYITVILRYNENDFCGQLSDLSTGLFLEGAEIRIANKDFTTSSDIEGFFSIPTRYSRENLIISYIGFKSIEQPVLKLGENCSEIFLQPSILELNQVMLETFFTKGISKQLDGSFKIATDNFGLLPGQVDGDVLQIAQALPGVESVDETISNINIRGGTHDENNILWDDIKMYQSGHFFGLISAFSPDLTKEVTVYKNGTPSRFGEGVSGVIDMRSENKIPTTIRGGAGFNLINSNGFAEIPLSKSFGVQVSGRRSINDFIRSPIFSIYEDRIFQDTAITELETSTNGADVSSENDFNFYDFSGKILWDPSEASRIRVNFLTIDNELEFTETLNATLSSETSKLEQKSIVGGISWQQVWSENLSTTLLGYGSFYRLNALNEDILTTQEQKQENEVLETGLKLDMQFDLTSKSQIQAGYHFSETGIANTQDVNLPRFRNYEKSVLRTHVGIANYHFKFNNYKSTINVGLRANYFTKFNKVLLEPRVNAHYALGSGFSLEVLGEFKSQTTTQRIDFESDFLGVEKRRWVLSDELDVPIIKSKQASMGFVYNKENWFINIEGFYKLVDGITSTNQGFQNQFQFVKSKGEYVSKGLEFVLNKKTKRFSTWFTYMFMRNDYTFEDLVPSKFSSNLDIRHTATLASTLTLKKLKFALGINWHSGKPYTAPEPGNEFVFHDGFPEIQYSLPNEERLPYYFRTNLAAEYLWNVSERLDAKFNFAILNLFNTKNKLNRRYALDIDQNNEVRVNQIDELSLGWTPNFSLQILF